MVLCCPQNGRSSPAPGAPILNLPCPHVLTAPTASAPPCCPPTARRPGGCTAAAGLGFPSGHTAVAAALATAAGPYLGRRGRRISWCGIWIVAIARIYVGAHFPLDTVGGAALGWVIGAGLHLAWGAPGGQPTPARVREALQRAGIEVSELRLLRADARGSTPFLAQDTAGVPLFVKAVGRTQPAVRPRTVVSIRPRRARRAALARYHGRWRVNPRSRPGSGARQRRNGRCRTG